MSAEENKAIVRCLFEELYNQRNLDIVDKLLDPNCILHDPNIPPGVIPSGTFGPKILKISAGMTLRAFPDLQINIEDETAEEDRVAMRLTGKGTYQEELYGLPIAPNGNRVTLQGIFMMRIVNGKIVEGWASYNALGMLQQIGAIPALGQ